MKAIVLHQHGGVEEFKFQEVPTPELGPKDVKVAIKAVSLNFLDILVRRGSPGLHVEFPHIGGGDMAGEIVATGNGVSEFYVGQRILVQAIYTQENGRPALMGEQGNGGLCEYMVLPKEHIIPIADSLSYEDAACLPVAYGTAWRMLMTRGKLTKEDSIFILGAAGGVGTGCLQIAKMVGCKKIFVAAGSQEKLELLKELGAHELINYKEEPEFHKAIRSRNDGKPVDVVVNYVGGESWATSLKCLKNDGRLLTCGGAAGYWPKTDLRYIFGKELNIIGSDGWTMQDLKDLIKATEEGRIKPVIDSVMPFSKIAEAHQRIENREVIGKIVLTPDFD
ncbi:Putative zinc-binding dehydrogenase [Croceitalea dokdonensis DOKDO 023]|uniref:Putative zinc-binding dehydrogenase n=1 Tax=Croceitalea dokdonensis DOKDO 023 TaxID=1300341 RepID=A0A0P7AVR3_9FLAO|nr:zinc-binding dehydrogenase [Croceitalea dokdonensis]KPM32056.1 Putative zinc-binding dehydrogenase [Croceitalea dokdonensis DOKDO 023]